MSEDHAEGVCCNICAPLLLAEGESVVLTGDCERLYEDILHLLDML